LSIQISRPSGTSGLVVAMLQQKLAVVMLVGGLHSFNNAVGEICDHGP